MAGRKGKKGHSSTANQKGKPKKTCPKCGEAMDIVVTLVGWRKFWQCGSCGYEQAKVKGDVEFLR